MTERNFAYRNVFFKKSTLTKDIHNREIFWKGIDYSYYYEEIEDWYIFLLERSIYQKIFFLLEYLFEVIQMKTLQLKENLYYVGCIDHSLKVFDSVMTLKTEHPIILTFLKQAKALWFLKAIKRALKKNT